MISTRRRVVRALTLVLATFLLTFSGGAPSWTEQLQIGPRPPGGHHTVGDTTSTR